MKIVRIILAVLLALAAAGAVWYLIYENLDIFSGDRIRTPDCYLLVFERMNQKDSHTMAVRAGDTLAVEFAVDGGRVDLVIDVAGEKLYRGNEIGSAAFELTVPKDGDCRVTVLAKHAAGFVKIFAHAHE